MPLRPEDVADARDKQQIAAHDTAESTRLVAGPGTGKSSSIEERFRWLLQDQQVDVAAIYGVSFTRASANDLRIRVSSHLADAGLTVDPTDLNISTLHSLAMRLLANADLLGMFPARPRVFDEWEVENVFDAEFHDVAG